MPLHSVLPKTTADRRPYYAGSAAAAEAAASKVKAVSAMLRNRVDAAVASDRAVNGLLDHAWGGAHTEGSPHLGAGSGGGGGGSLRLNVGHPIFQQYHAPARLHGRAVVTSAWVVRGLPVAACFREDTAKTTNNDSCFVPHFVEAGAAPAALSTEYPLTDEQRTLRSELYGSDPSAAAESGERRPAPAAAVASSASHPGIVNGFHPRPRVVSTNSYSRGGSGRGGFSSTGGGGARPPPPAAGGNGKGSSWWSRLWSRKQGAAPRSSGPHGSTTPMGGGPRSAGRTRGKPGSVGATGKAASGYARSARHRVGATGRATGRGGGGGRG